MSKKEHSPIRLLVSFLALSLAGVMFAGAAALAQDDLILTYTVKEARAYGYKVSLNTLVFEAAGYAPCETDKPETPYNDCDKSQFDPRQNCPPSIAIGPKGTAPNVSPPATPAQGGAGDNLGSNPAGGAPPQANPVRLNELLSSMRLGRLGQVLESGGISSETYVDNDGRSTGDRHTESDGFSPNRLLFGERCWDGDNDVANGSTSYTHFVSKSDQRPGGFNLADCRGERCSRSGVSDSPRPTAQKALSLSRLYEEGGKLKGVLYAEVSDMKFTPEGSPVPLVTAKSVISHASFETDGTPGGLKWSAITTASGVEILGVPQALPAGSAQCGVAAPGQQTPAFCIGVAGPYIRAPEDGSQLTLIVPGLYTGNEQQATFVAGGEAYVGMDRVPASNFKPTGGTFDTITSAGTAAIPAFGSGPEGGLPIAPASVPASLLDEAPVVAVRELPSSPWALIIILTLGALSLLMLLAGWVQRFSWGRRLYRVQPFRFFDWTYRAFIRT